MQHIEPMKDAVAITYSDQGVYDDPIGKEIINVAQKDGTLITHRAFAEQHGLQYDICMAKVKPYACLSYIDNKIIHVNEQFQLLKVTACPFEVGNVLAMSYHYPYFIFIEENRWLYVHEDGSLKAFEQSFTYLVRSVMHRGVTEFIEIFEQRVVGYSVEI